MTIRQLHVGTHVSFKFDSYIGCNKLIFQNYFSFQTIRKVSEATIGSVQEVPRHW